MQDIEALSSYVSRWRINNIQGTSNEINVGVNLDPHPQTLSKTINVWYIFSLVQLHFYEEAYSEIIF